MVKKEVSDGKSAKRITDVIATMLNCLDNAIDKLVSHTYDGVAVMAGTLGGVQSSVATFGVPS